MLPMVAAIAWPSAAVPVVSWALLMLALPGEGRASQVVTLQGTDAAGDDDLKIKALKVLSKSVKKDRKKQRPTKPKPVQRRSRVRGVRPPAAPRFKDDDNDFTQQEVRQQFFAAKPRFHEAGPQFQELDPRPRDPAPRHRGFVSRPRDPAPRHRGSASRPRDPAHRLRDNRRQRPPSVATSFVESMSSPITGPRDIVRGQVPEQPSLRNFMTRFRGLVLTGLGSMVPTFSP